VGRAAFGSSVFRHGPVNVNWFGQRRIVMEHNLPFQLRTDDIIKMQPVVFGRHYRLLVVCASVPMLAFGLSNIFRGENLILSGISVIPATVMLRRTTSLGDISFNTDLSTKPMTISISNANLVKSICQKELSLIQKTSTNFGRNSPPCWGTGLNDQQLAPLAVGEQV